MQTNSLKDFEIMKKLGEGAFGHVYLVRRKIDHEIYAMKKVKMIGLKEKERQNSINEIRILASFNCNNVIKFKQAFFDPDSAYLCIVMQYAAGGDLLKQIDTHLKSRCRFKEGQIWKALYDIAKGLKSLHDKKILHRDLKSANIFISEDGTFKIGDLNVSKVLKKELAHTQTGTPYYASPQVWNDLPYDSKSDIWSFGCILYEMAALSPPFKANDLQGLYKKVKYGVFNPVPSCYSNELCEFIASMLKLNPKQRPSAQEILKNPIVKKHLGTKFQESLPSNSQKDHLLNTIKFNPYNLKSLKQNLPRSAYGDEDNLEEFQSSRRKLLTEENHNRGRTQSVVGFRSNISKSPSIEAKQNSREVSKLMSPRPSIDQGHLPPISGRKNIRDPSMRMQKIGLEILDAPRQYSIKERVHSHHQ